jgi:hypothetical protein
MQFAYRGNGFDNTFRAKHTDSFIVRWIMALASKTSQLQRNLVPRQSPERVP